MLQRAVANCRRGVDCELHIGTPFVASVQYIVNMQRWIQFFLAEALLVCQSLPTQTDAAKMMSMTSIHVVVMKLQEAAQKPA